MPGKPDLQKAYLKTLDLLEKTKTPYVVIGGLAAGMLGEPRATMDVDFDIAIDRKDLKAIHNLMSAAKKLGFTLNENLALEDLKTHGTFKFLYGGTAIDFITASSKMEKSVFKRRRELKLYGRKAYFPTPEDLILLKIVPNRTQDFLDMERIVQRYGKKLNRKYLEDWARKLSEEAENYRIFHTLQKLLGKS